MKIIFSNKKQSNERGATMVEYALIAALIGAVCIVGATQFSSDLSSSVKETGNTTSNVTTGVQDSIGIHLKDDHSGIDESNSSETIKNRCRVKYGNENCEVVPGRGLQLKEGQVRSKDPCEYIMSGECRDLGGNFRCTTFKNGVRKQVNGKCSEVQTEEGS